MSPIARRLAASRTTTKCMVIEFEPLGDCIARPTHSRTTESSTGRSKSSRLRTARVVDSSSSGVSCSSSGTIGTLVVGPEWWVMEQVPCENRTVQTALDDLVTLLDLEVIEVNLFRGRSPDENRQRVFGGQVAGQALVAAARTVDQHPPTPPRLVHSLHAYFL